MRDEWLVLDLCGNGHRDLDGVVRSSKISISDDCSQQKETARNPDGPGVICRSEKPADSGGTGVACGRKSCKCRW